MARRKYDVELVNKYREMYSDAFDDADANLKGEHGWVRLKRMNAWITCENLKIFLKSYDTIVAFYDIEKDVLIVRGRYSITTYQQISKFKKHLETTYGQIYNQINLELVDWF